MPHTPGPWRLSRAAPRGYHVSVEAQSPTYVSAHVAIADLPDNLRAGEADANARVIVEAPNLLDALRAFCGDYESLPFKLSTLSAAYLRAREVIAKVDGE